MMAVHKHAAGRVALTRRSTQPVSTSHVHALVWGEALRLARGRTSLIRVIDSRHVRVLDDRYSPAR